MTPTWLFWPAPSGGGGDWDPSQLSSLIAWWKFDELTGANGSTVTSVPDIMGTYDLTASSSPTLVTSAQNGLNAVSLASGTFTAGASYSGNDPGFSVYVIAKREGTTINQHVSGGSGNGHLVGSNASFQVWIRAYKSDNSRYESISSNWSLGWDIVGFSSDFSSGTLDVSLNGSSITSLTGLATGLSQFQTFKLGTFGGSPWRGEVGEELIVNNSLSLSDRQKVEGYLSHKWGLTSNLPISHPYKSSPPSV